MLDLKVIGQRIADLRKQNHMSQNELAEALFVTRQAVSKWEIGKGMPNIEILLALTNLFNVSIDYLLDHTDLSSNDYENMLMTYPRPSVIYHFLNSKHPNRDIKDFFYLLKTEERKQMIDQILSKQISIDIISVWPYANSAERKYMLGHILTHNESDIVLSLRPFMTNEERNMSFTNDNHYRMTYYSEGGKK